MHELLDEGQDFYRPRMVCSFHETKCMTTYELGLIAFASRSLTNAETRYSNIERKALGILQAVKLQEN